MSLKDIAAQVNPGSTIDIFDDTGSINKELVEQYYQTNERKKADEKWLKEHKPVIEKALTLLNRDKVDVGNLRVSVVVPDTSKFDDAMVVQYLSDRGHTQAIIVKRTVNEAELEALVSEGVIDIADLKSEAWVASKGTPRLTIGKVKSSE